MIKGRRMELQATFLSKTDELYRCAVRIQIYENTDSRRRRFNP